MATTSTELRSKIDDRTGIVDLSSRVADLWIQEDKKREEAMRNRHGSTPAQPSQLRWYPDSRGRQRRTFQGAETTRLQSLRLSTPLQGGSASGGSPERFHGRRVPLEGQSSTGHLANSALNLQSLNPLFEVAQNPPRDNDPSKATIRVGGKEANLSPRPNPPAEAPPLFRRPVQPRVNRQSLGRPLGVALPTLDHSQPGQIEAE